MRGKLDGFMMTAPDVPQVALSPGELGYPVSGILGADSGMLLTHRGPAAVSSEIGGNDRRDWKVVGAFAIV